MKFVQPESIISATLLCSCQRQKTISSTSICFINPRRGLPFATGRGLWTVELHSPNFGGYADHDHLLCCASADEAHASKSPAFNSKDSTGSFKESDEEPERKHVVVIGGGAAGLYGALHVAAEPSLKVTVLEQGRLPLAKVKVSGGGRCNVTTALFTKPREIAGQYPRGHRELSGSFFRAHGPAQTADWFRQRGVPLKTEEDGRMFPVSDSSSSIINCLLSEAQRLNVSVQTGSLVHHISRPQGSDAFHLQLHSTTPSRPPSVLSAHYVLLATGSDPRGHLLARGLGHSIIEPRPSLFTFKLEDSNLTALAGVSFPMVRARLELPADSAFAGKDPHLVQEGPLLITHWGLSGPLVLRLSAWAARHLYDTSYQATLTVDFLQSQSREAVFEALLKQKDVAKRRKMGSGPPPDMAVSRRFWTYVLEDRLGLNPDLLWSATSNKLLRELAHCLKGMAFAVEGKGKFKEEFVTAGGVSLSEVDLTSMESRVVKGLFLAGEVLNVDGVTGGFNFQNAWTGGFIAGSAMARLASQDSQLGCAQPPNLNEC
eukprot:TRINITY_DN3716_c0_g1_i1.p1 TRINITY_DN3716_c0_g1~~TRINITY_DN3716_c0_g1_i1.p1  ORF type:complete len:544 (-),score=71.12 TRINITY_DN3716_c0_g1_i1:255-1886(-)